MYYYQWHSVSEQLSFLLVLIKEVKKNELEQYCNAPTHTHYIE